jgi:peptidoglycan hydrolase-like protein with peptidoglycan-binding domain
MTKMINISDSEKKIILELHKKQGYNTISEQAENINPLNLSIGAGGKNNPKQIPAVRLLQQKLIDKGLLKTKTGRTTGYFGNLTNAALSKYLDSSKTKVKPITKTKQFCEPHPKDNRVDPKLEVNYQPEAIKLRKLGIPQRTSCEISFIKLRPEFTKKPFFVVDTRENLIYLFGTDGQFVAKSYTLDGAHGQSQDAKKIAQALMTFEEEMTSIGLSWDSKTRKYKDSKGKTVENYTDKFYDNIDKIGARFFPKGIYSIHNLSTDKEYAGGSNNIFNIKTLDGKQISQAIHGFYNEPPRVEALQRLKSKMGKSFNPENPNVPQEFIDEVTKYLNTSKYNRSYGCINVPADFLEKAKPYAKQKPMVFIIGETENNYLVNNSDDFFNKMGQGEDCVNPAKLGTPISFNNVA